MTSPYLSSGMLSGVTATTSPMSAGARPRSFNSRYNPQEWGPISGGTSPVAATGMVHQPAPSSTSVTASPPPPPYSPPRATFRGQRAQSPQVGYPVASSPSPISAPIQQSTAPSQSRQRESPGYHYSVPRPGPSPSVGSHELEQPQRPDNRTSFIPSHSIHPQPSVNDGSSRHYGAGSDLGRTEPTPSGTPQTVLQSVPPASRRAVSTGDLPHGRTSNRASTLADSQLSSRNGRWEPGMPLPPPPPGPPPASAPRRTSFSSQSAVERNNLPQNREERLRSGSGSSSIEPTLPTIPATPLGWVADQVNAPITPRRTSASPHDQNRSVPASPSLSNAVANNHHDASSQSTPSSIRAQSQKGIRERRIQSRNNRTESSAHGQEPKDESNDMSWPTDLVLNSPVSGGLVRRRTLTRATPRSARSNPGEEPLHSARSATSPFSNKMNTITSPYSATPRLQTFPHEPLANRGQTPPFSPGREQKSPTMTSESLHLPPKALPTPPPAQQQDATLLGLEPRSAGSDRPLSHLLHLPVDVSPLEAQPLVPVKAPSRRASPKCAPYAPIDGKFIQDAERRYHEYLRKESEATNATDALQAFCNFIIAESGIRRQHYGSQWSDLTYDPKTVADKLFELSSNPLKVEARPRDSSVGPSEPPQTPDRVTPKRRTSVIESGLGNGYKPALSPIASMSMSNEESSRGRAPSRWWESQTGSDNGDVGGKVSRTKREAKYMGLPREMREAMQMDHLTPTQAAYDQQYSGDQNPYANYGPNEYPPEKVGWNDLDAPQPPGPSRTLSAINREARKLDISRLVTLPPPYPRHYPGVNNNHPDMAFYRTTVRTISDLSEVHATKASFEKKMKALREKHQKEAQEELRGFRVRMNQGIESGSISYADAADAEAGRQAQANEKEREIVQTEFDMYSVQVLEPMQSILKDRIKIATACIDELRGKLFDSAQRQTPDQTQEEGDEEPELVEKLTQLKWLFDGRENLFREEYDILSERNELFRAVVSLPYRQAKNTEKLTETDNFFIRDAQDRKLAFVAETLKRFESFMDVIEANVSRGVETQLSAFWDIAPPIVTILQEIPQSLEGFSVRIPQKEYDENPSYYQFPLQYLYSLVTHAGKSTYQFIESQTNLLCLLHEIKFGLMNANCKFMEVQRIISGEPEEDVRREMQESRSEEERILTLDLKEKVGMVEGQWAEALGQQLENVKERVRRRLVSEGGWEEMEQMEQT
ncbi:hypothetical protein H101_05341 [Trichophyton interdigitale H6]|nr:hypothetical protein H101_05341 [Trichophyton interdigitale H6]